MSAKHLTVGSVEPPRVEGLLRLYSMLFCPFAQRTRLVLKAKQIPHDIVNINLYKKPEWYFKIHPEGKVPALLDGSKVIVESLDISDYLDEKFPDKNPLYPSDPAAKQKDKDVINKLFNPIQGVFNKVAFGSTQKTPEEWVKDFMEVLQPLEDELARRNTTYFGGDKPGMVDYMIWPWAERAPCLAFKLGQKLPFQDDQVPLLRKWRKAMRNDPTVAELFIEPEKFWKIAQAKMKGEDPPYDNLD